MNDLGVGISGGVGRLLPYVDAHGQNPAICLDRVRKNRHGAVHDKAAPFGHHHLHYYRALT